MKKSDKASACILLTLALGGFVFLPSLFVYLADPCHLFHKPFPGPFAHGFTDLNPCQNAGLIRTYLNDPAEGFDSILVGTSLSTNFLSDRIRQHTGWKHTMKLTLPASAPAVQQVFVQQALATGQVRHVFWEVFPYKYLPYQDLPPEGTPDELGDFPSYMFNANPLDDYRYVFNYTILMGAVNVVLGDEYFNRPSIDHINYWHNQCEEARSCKPFKTQEEILEMQRAYTPVPRPISAPGRQDAFPYHAVDRYLLATVLPHCNAGTSFDLYIPPVSMHWFSRLEPHPFDYQLYLARHLVNRTASCLNARVFAFGDVAWIVGDLAHYSDDFHFFANVQDYMLQSFGGARHQLTPHNIDQYEQSVIQQAASYHPWGSTQEEIRRRAQ